MTRSWGWNTAKAICKIKMNWRGLLNVSQNSAKIYHQYLWGIRISDILGKFLYNLFKHNFQDSNPNVLKQMSSPRPVSGVTCSGQISAERWGKFREPWAAPSAGGGQRQALSMFRNKQLTEECLDEYCVPVAMTKVLTSHTNQVKGLPLPLVNILQHGWCSAERGRAFSTSQMSRAGHVNCTHFSLQSWRS